ncbi:ATP-binding protein [Gordonia alkanivorans]|uniref:ATP-binding protein n=1 Tax=Gordonia alkanivorans TaxID=84096 RepID=UPI001E5C36B3|nr:AAA family ATPase [Gordonia alkanivorans]MDH3007565.1 AAA family ATPase [Gordonia alkanivorans]MDH3047211.1 AAA family ATPase [Gordonia alkanivorans]MDJ0009290.1 AAA family ATPase [Gordonia alkanivorans]MDJ0099189.1 AAA family ATPase [Gordonia alkanivorans]MDJ0494865.1 AAA family ATPase [Gordonia alkanivorans]
MAATSDARAGLVGRDAELAALRAFLDSARNDGAALLLTGDPGVGKTALPSFRSSSPTSSVLRGRRRSGQSAGSARVRGNHGRIR